MDQENVSKETLVRTLREAVCHVNRNLYEWTTGAKKGKIQLTLGFNEVRGLVRNWLIRSLRDKIGYGEADRIFRGMYITMEPDYGSIKSISLSSEGRYCRMYKPINEVLLSLSYQNLRYNPNDYVMDGMSERKKGFDPFFYISLDEIKSITF